MDIIIGLDIWASAHQDDAAYLDFLYAVSNPNEFRILIDCNQKLIPGQKAPRELARIGKRMIVKDKLVPLVPDLVRTSSGPETKIILGLVKASKCETVVTESAELARACKVFGDRIGRRIRTMKAVDALKMIGEATTIGKKPHSI